MPKIHTSRSKVINAPIDGVFKAVANMGEWAAWSPWLILEPEAKVDNALDGKSYSWDGERVGAGHMEITERIENVSARYDLTFLRPFKSTAKVGMDVRAVEGGTEVMWSMDSSLPFFMFFMKKMMETYIGMDYERGLKLLADYVVDGKVYSHLNFIGESEHSGCDYVGITRHTTMAEMPEVMQADFQTLMPWAVQNGLNPADGFAIYHKFNPVKGVCSFTSAIACVDVPADIPAEFSLGTQAPSRISTVEHTGAYDHLGNAWSAMYMKIRNKEIKPVKGNPPFETYLNSPMDTPPHDLKTRVNFPIN